MIDLQKTYHRRFEPDLAFRQKMWQTLCGEYFQQYIPLASRVMEIGAGYCEFINNIQAAEKLAIDLNPDTTRYANLQVRVILSNTTDLSSIPDQYIDVAFASNFFEHLERADIVSTIRETRRVLRSGGKFIILQPNIRFSYRDYWMFFDHITPIDDRGLAEALEVNGFEGCQNYCPVLAIFDKKQIAEIDISDKDVSAPTVGLEIHWQTVSAHRPTSFVKLAYGFDRYYYSCL